MSHTISAIFTPQEVWKKGGGFVYLRNKRKCFHHRKGAQVSGIMLSSSRMILLSYSLSATLTSTSLQKKKKKLSTFWCLCTRTTEDIMRKMPSTSNPYCRNGVSLCTLVKFHINEVSSGGIIFYTLPMWKLCLNTIFFFFTLTSPGDPFPLVTLDLQEN